MRSVPALFHITSLLLAAACSRGDAPPAAHVARVGGVASDPIVVSDGAGKLVRMTHPARRVVSMLPSGTEMLQSLGALDRVVGRTDYDRMPEVAALPSVGGGLTPNIEAIVALSPDLVLTWEGGKADDPIRSALERAGIAVYGMATRDTTDVFRTLRDLAHLIGRDSAGVAVAGQLGGELADVRKSVAGRRVPTVLLLLWGEPPMTAGPATFVSQVIGVAGGRTAFPDLAKDWMQVSVEQVVNRDPDVIVLPTGETSTATLAQLRSAPGWRDLRAVRSDAILRIDADLVNRPGPHMGQAARALREGFAAIAARAERLRRTTASR